MISMAAFSRSHHQCKLQKLNTIYFKSYGLSNKAFDTLHALGITMSQKWAYTGVEQLACSAHWSLLHDVAQYPFFGCHDNINLAFKVYEKHLSNQDCFDSGTAATIIIIKDPACMIPNSQDARKQLAERSKDIISCYNIFALASEAAPRLKKYYIYHILKVLMDSVEFNLHTYEHTVSCIIDGKYEILPVCLVLFTRHKQWWPVTPPITLHHRPLPAIYTMLSKVEHWEDLEYTWDWLRVEFIYVQPDDSEDWLPARTFQNLKEPYRWCSCYILKAQ